MQTPTTVLDVIRERGRKGLPLERLYRQLFNPELFLIAYANLYGNAGAMTKGITQESADAMSVAKSRTSSRNCALRDFDGRPSDGLKYPRKTGGPGRLASPHGRISCCKKLCASSWKRTTSRNSPTAVMVFDRNAARTPR